MADREIRLRFNNAKEIKRSLTKINNMLINGKIKHYDATAISTLCNTILKAEKQLETEKKIEELEEILADLKERNII